EVLVPVLGERGDDEGHPPSVGRDVRIGDPADPRDVARLEGTARWHGGNWIGHDADAARSAGAGQTLASPCYAAPRGGEMASRDRGAHAGPARGERPRGPLPAI